MYKTWKSQFCVAVKSIRLENGKRWVLICLKHFAPPALCCPFPDVTDNCLLSKGKASDGHGNGTPHCSSINGPTTQVWQGTLDRSRYILTFVQKWRLLGALEMKVWKLYLDTFQFRNGAAGIDNGNSSWPDGCGGERTVHQTEIRCLTEGLSRYHAQFNSPLQVDAILLFPIHFFMHKW